MKKSLITANAARVNSEKRTGVGGEVKIRPRFFLVQPTYAIFFSFITPIRPKS